MSITKYKALIWVGALGVAGYLGWYVYDFFRHKEVLQQAVSEETQTKVLTSIPPVEPPKDDVVDYELVKRTWHGMDWTGKPPAKAVDGPKTGEELKPQVKAVNTLLKVLLVQVDGGQPERSMAHVQFLDPTLSASNPTLDDQILQEGEKLKHPYDYAQVAKISRAGVHFRFLNQDGEPDAERAEEIVEPSRIVGAEGIVRVGPDGVIMPTTPKIPGVAVPMKPRVVPRETIQIGDDRFLAGLDDRALFQKDYTRLLAELRFDKHYSKSGKPDGIELKDVPKGSFAAKYGAKTGQVIKSINGHPINSVNEGISFAKQNAEKYTVWEIVYIEQGKEKTKIIDTSE